MIQRRFIRQFAQRINFQQRNIMRLAFIGAGNVNQCAFFYSALEISTLRYFPIVRVIILISSNDLQHFCEKKSMEWYCKGGNQSCLYFWLKWWNLWRKWFWSVINCIHCKTEKKSSKVEHFQSRWFQRKVGNVSNFSYFLYIKRWSYIKIFLNFILFYPCSVNQSVPPIFLRWGPLPFSFDQM